MDEGKRAAHACPRHAASILMMSFRLLILPLILARRALCGPTNSASMAPRKRRRNFRVGTDFSEALLLQMQQHNRRPLLQLQIAPLEAPDHPIEFTQ
ncbi:hypothetical protein [Methylocystis iwaonis]|uniref:hypothetical protein n=1 Tax=Methylocystis iwaonis TaxID=2885079 RepID=UPI002E7B4792|nr:hypothetical protein [Methylocystis iwaonis]